MHRPESHQGPHNALEDVLLSNWMLSTGHNCGHSGENPFFMNGNALCFVRQAKKRMNRLQLLGIEYKKDLFHSNIASLLRIL